MSHSSFKQTSQADMDGIDFHGMVQDLLAEKRLIGIIVSIAIVIGIFCSLIKTPQYQSNLLLQVESHKQPAMSGMIQQASALALGGSASSDSGEVQSALIHSRYILEPVIETLNLDVAIKPYHAAWLDRFYQETHAIHFAKLTIPHAYINRRLKLTFIDQQHYFLSDTKGHKLLQGTVGTETVSKDNEFAMNIDKANITDPTTFSVKKRSMPVVIEKILPRLKIIDMSTLMGDTQKTGVLQVTFTDPDPELVTNFLNVMANVLQDKDFQKKVIESDRTIAFLTSQLPILKSALENAETHLNRYRAKSGKLDIKLQTQYLIMHLTELDKQIEFQGMYRDAMKQQYTPEHPLYQAVLNKINELTKQRNKLQKELTQLPASDQIAINMMRDVNIKNELYLAVLKKRQEMQIEKAAKMSDVRILSFAVLPDEHLPMGRLITIFSFALLGFMFACAFILGRKMFLRQIDDPYWVERHLDLVNLAIIPYSKQQAEYTTTGRTIPILAEKMPHDLTIEALRSLRTNLQVMILNATNNVITITGVSPNIGKSFIIVNFSYLLAELGKRILVIDGDMRRGYLNKYYESARSPGLVEVLCGSIDFASAVKKTRYENIFFLPTGAPIKNTAELLTKPQFKELLQQGSEQFDFVLIDTPPVLAVTDGVLISAHAGMNFLVVGSRTHQPEEIESALKILSNAGVKTHGAIFNHLTETKSLHRYQYQYDSVTH